jgi:hypothetical protein
MTSTHGGPSLRRPRAGADSASRSQSRHDLVMTSAWQTLPAGEVRPGDRIRLPSGDELIVSRIETAFFGRPNMLAFIEDTSARWYKQPMPADREVEVARG